MAPLLPPSKKIGVSSSSITISSKSLVGSQKENKISSGALVKRENASIVKNFKNSSISLNKIINITQKDQKEDLNDYKKEKAQKIKERDTKKKQDTEKELESKLGVSFPKLSGINLPSVRAPGFLNRIFEAIFWIGLGWVIDKLIDQNSFLNRIFRLIETLANFLNTIIPPLLKGIFAFVEHVSPFILGGVKFLFDAFFKAIDIADDTHNSISNFIKSKFGEENLEKFDKFGNVINKLIDTLIIFATANALLGDDGLGLPGGSNRRRLSLDAGGKPTGGGIGSPLASGKPSAISQYLSKDPKSFSIRRDYGPNAQKIYDNAFENAIKRGKTPTQARITAATKVNKLVAAGKITAQKLPGLAGPGQKAGRIFARGPGRAVGRFLLKTFGQAKLAGIKATFGKIPIIGPLFTVFSSLLSGEPIGKAAFKGIGAALGGFIGGAIGMAGGPLSIVGLTVGQFVGEFLGDALYELIFGGGIGALKGIAVNVAKSVVRNLLRTPKFLIDGFSSLISSLGNSAKYLWDFVKGIWEKVTNFDYFAFIKNAFDWLAKTGQMVWESFVNFAKDFIGNALGKAGEIVNFMIERGKEYVKDPFKIVTDVSSFLINSIETLDKVINTVIQTAVDVIGKIDFVQLTMNIIDFVGKTFVNISKFTNDLVMNIGKQIFKLGDKVLSFLGVVIGKGKEFLSYMVDHVRYAIQKSIQLFWKISFPHLLWRGFKFVSDLTKKSVEKIVNFVEWFSTLPLIPQFVKDAVDGVITKSLIMMENIRNTILKLEPFKNIGEIINGIKNFSTDLYNNVVSGKLYQSTMKSLFDFADFKDPQEEKSLKDFYNVGGEEEKNIGGIVGYNMGGIVSNNNSRSFVPLARPNENFKNSYGTINSSAVRMSPNKQSKVNLTNYTSPKYDVTTIKHSMDYDMGYIEHTRAVVLVKPVVVV